MDEQRDQTEHERIFANLDGSDSLYDVGRAWRQRLDLTATWIDGRGSTHILVHMTEDHRNNVRRYLRRRVRSIRMAVEFYEIASIDARNPISDQLLAEAEITHEGQTDLEWLYAQPLYRALVATESGPLR